MLFDPFDPLGVPWWDRWHRTWSLIGVCEATTHNLMVLRVQTDPVKQRAVAWEIASTIVAGMVRP